MYWTLMLSGRLSDQIIKENYTYKKGNLNIRQRELKSQHIEELLYKTFIIRTPWVTTRLSLFRLLSRV